MRMILSVLGLFLTLAVVGVVFKQQLQAGKTGVPAVPMAGADAGASVGADQPPANQVQQVKSQVEQALAQGAAARASAAGQ